MVRGWVRLSLTGSGLRLAGEAASAAEAHELIARRAPDVLLVDYRLPDGRGTELVSELRRSGTTIPAVLMTATEEKGFNERARDAGAQGTVLKTGKAEDLIAAIRIVSAGGVSFDSRHPRREEGRGTLSPRERDALRLVAAGATNREIAEQLGVGAETVKTLLARAFAKLGTRRRAEAVAEAHRLGLL